MKAHGDIHADAHADAHVDAHVCKRRLAIHMGSLNYLGMHLGRPIRMHMGRRLVMHMRGGNTQMDAHVHVCVDTHGHMLA